SLVAQTQTTQQQSAPVPGAPPTASQSAPVPGQQPTPPPTSAEPAESLTTEQESLGQQPQPPAPQPITLPAQLQLPTTGPAHRLTIEEAEALAIKNNPRISVNRLIYLASHQVTREQQSAFYPTLSGDLTGIDAEQGSRIAAGNLNSPRLLTRAAGGLVLSQLITDFGRTSNLAATAALRAREADMNTAATVNDIRLAVDQAFYNALQNAVMMQVAEETVRERQVVSKQITTLYNNRLRSEVDVSFADANLAQAQLLLLDAQNNYQAALSMLSQVLGYPSQQQFELVETDTEIKPPPDSASQLEDEAFLNRPEIAAQRYEYQADQRYQKAQRDQLFPTIDAVGVVGKTPVGSTFNGAPAFLPNWYGAVGVNVSIPIFNGFLFPAQSKEAYLRAQAANEQLRDLKDRIANDVRTSWLNAITAYHRIAVSEQFVEQTNLALKLSQQRYNLGLSSIVELSQAQLQQTAAQIEYAAAKYQYRIAQAVVRFEVAGP
ncbi:MAG TPA: TolC family protein, partial [Terriglobales bacterium]|nr:TolC family protein [Terriglobales bacterium]